MTANNSGVKNDSGKIRIELIPSELLFSVGTVLTKGATIYGDRNWEKGMSWSRVFGALMRHMWAWWAGQGPTSVNFAFGNLDPDTGYSHLWHAGCCIAFLIAYEERRSGFDDRPSINAPAAVPPFSRPTAPDASKLYDRTSYGSTFND